MVSLRRLLPGPVADVEAFDLYQVADEPIVRVGMVASVDGSATDESGWTDGLGGPPDLEVFRALRAHADGIMMGASTLRSGRVGPHRMRHALAERRRAAGRAGPAAMIVVTGSLDLDWTAPVFTDARTPTLVLTHWAADRERVPADRRDQVVTAGEQAVDLASGVRLLRERYGLRSLLCEGGPRLAAGLMAAGLADELCLSVAPVLLGATFHMPILATLPRRTSMTIRSLAVADDVILVRYRLTPLDSLPAGGFTESIG